MNLPLTYCRMLIQDLLQFRRSPGAANCLLEMKAGGNEVNGERAMILEDSVQA